MIWIVFLFMIGQCQGFRSFLIPTFKINYCMNVYIFLFFFYLEEIFQHSFEVPLLLANKMTLKKKNLSGILYNYLFLLWSLSAFKGSLSSILNFIWLVHRLCHNLLSKIFINILFNFYKKLRILQDHYC